MKASLLVIILNLLQLRWPFFSFFVWITVSYSFNYLCVRFDVVQIISILHLLSPILVPYSLSCFCSFLSLLPAWLLVCVGFPWISDVWSIFRLSKHDELGWGNCYSMCFGGSWEVEHWLSGNSLIVKDVERSLVFLCILLLPIVDS